MGVASAISPLVGLKEIKLGNGYLLDYVASAISPLVGLKEIYGGNQYEVFGVASAISPLVGLSKSLGIYSLLKNETRRSSCF